MLTYKILKLDDTDELSNLMLSRPEVFNGYTDDAHKKYIKESVPEFLTNNLFFSIGICFNNELIGCLITKEFTTAPAWCWAHWLMKKSFNLANYKDLFELVKELDHVLFNEMENVRNLNRFHFAYKADGEGVRNLGSADRFLQWASKIKTTRISEYQFMRDGILEPNTMPKYDYQKNMILNRTWPLKLGFRICVKKDKT